jgi:hypothetical protein
MLIFCAAAAFIPDKKNHISAGQAGGDVYKDSCGVSAQQGDFSEHFLPHGVIGADVKHVDISVRMKNDVKYSGNRAADEITAGAAGKFPQGAFGAASAFVKAYSCHGAYNDEKNMPQIGMGGQGGVGVMHAACVKKCEDSPHHPEGHEESQKYFLNVFRHKRQQKAQIHRHAAELEGKVPPVVGMFIYKKCNAVLFPYFAE